MSTSTGWWPCSFIAPCPAKKRVVGWLGLSASSLQEERAAKRLLATGAEVMVSARSAGKLDSGHHPPYAKGHQRYETDQSWIKRKDIRVMKQVNLGSQGLRVPAIGLGCMGMSDFYGSSSEAQNLSVLDWAADIGCTFWDTSDMYGPFTNEILLSKALKGRRGQVTLATKFGVSRGEDGSWQGIKGSADYVKACCDASLKRLGTDYIDLYYQHRVDPETPIEETVGAMAELVKAGKVRYIGLSEADPETIARAHKVHPISALQTEYSLWSRDVEADILPTIRRLNIGFVAYSPLGRGFLSGAVRSRSDLEPGDWRLSNPRFTEEAIARNSQLTDFVAEIAKEIKATAAQVALAWALSRGVTAIPGTRRTERLEENWASQDITLRSEHLERLESLINQGVIGDRY